MSGIEFGTYSSNHGKELQSRVCSQMLRLLIVTETAKRLLQTYCVSAAGSFLKAATNLKGLLHRGSDFNFLSSMSLGFQVFLFF